MSHYNLTELRLMADEACERAFEDEFLKKHEAVNWTDLQCEESEYCVNDQNEHKHRVWISEASPDASKLREFIRDYLAENGFRNVDIQTNW